MIDRLGAPGDALLTAIVIHNLKRSFPRLRVNCITPHPELLKLDPLIDSLNEPETFFSFDSSYWDLVCHKVGDKVFIDKREDSQFDFLTVNETSHEPPSAEVPEDINSMQSLSQEVRTRHAWPRVLTANLDTGPAVGP